MVSRTGIVKLPWNPPVKWSPTELVEIVSDWNDTTLHYTPHLELSRRYLSPAIQ